MTLDYSRPPASLYKYYGFKGLQNTLQSHARLYSHPSRFNDPFDSQFKRRFTESLDEFMQSRPDIPEALRKSKAFKQLMALDHKQSLMRKTYLWETYFSQRLANTAILCLTEDRANLLMWAHYAQNHTGGVIEFGSAPGVNDCQAQDAKQVRYAKDIPVFSFLEFFTGFENAEKKREMADGFWDAYTLTKSLEWRYEKEWRVLLEQEEPAKTVMVDFDAKELAAVYLGCRATAKNRAETAALLKSEYPHAGLYQATTHNHKFMLEFERII